MSPWLIETIDAIMLLGTLSFICQGTSTRSSEVNFSVLKSSCHLLLPFENRGNPVKCLAQG